MPWSMPWITLRLSMWGTSILPGIGMKPLLIAGSYQTLEYMTHIVMSLRVFHKIKVCVDKYSTILKKIFTRWLLEKPFYALQDFFELAVIDL